MSEEVMRKHYEKTPKETLIKILVASRKEVEKLQNRNKERKQEIERLNNIINELEKWLEEDLKQVYRDAGHRHNLILEVLDKLQELKGSDKE